MKQLRLGEIAIARSGDKGNSANIGVIALDDEKYAVLEKRLTKEVVHDFFRPLNPQRVERFELPNLNALNFILHGVLAGGGSRSLRTDAQGKALGQALLELPLTFNDGE